MRRKMGKDGGDFILEKREIRGEKRESRLSEDCGFGFLGIEPLAQVDWR